MQSATEASKGLLLMNTPNLGDLSPENETQRHRARIAELEEEINHLRSGVDPGLRNNDALTESELQYKEIFDNISVCMFLLDVTSDGRFKFAGFNPAEEKAVEPYQCGSIRKICRRGVLRGARGEAYSNLSPVFAEAGGPISYDDELSLPSGQRSFHSNLIPMRNGTGRIQQIVGACIDTTDFKRTQQEALAR